MPGYFVGEVQGVTSKIVFENIHTLSQCAHIGFLSAVHLNGLL